VSDDRLDTLRREIVEADQRIVAAVNERLRLVAEIWAVKTDRGLPLLDEARERRLREVLGGGNDGPLSPEGLDELVSAILELTKRELGPGGAPVE
jgi:chorismate mutase